MVIDLGWTRAMTSGVISLYMLIYGVSSVLTGSLSDKYGPRFVLAFCTLLVAVGYIMLSGLKNPFQLYIYFGVMVGSGMGAAYILPVAAISKWFTLKKGLALGILSSGVGFGQIIYPPLIRFLISSSGWRVSFIVIGTLIGVLGIPAALLLRNPPSSSAISEQMSAQGANKASFTALESKSDLIVWKIIKTRSFLILLFIFMVLLVGISIIMGHLVAHVEDLRFDPMRAAFIITLIGISGIAGRILIGGAADWLDSKVLLTVCLIVQMLLFFILIFAKQLWLFYLVGACYGLTYGGAIPNIIILTSKYFGTAASGKIFGTLISGAMIGGAAGAPVAGYIYDVTNEYSIAFCIVGILILAASILSIFLKPPQ